MSEDDFFGYSSGVAPLPRVLITATILMAAVGLLAAPPAEAKKKLRVKPYPAAVVVPRPPRTDTVPLERVTPPLVRDSGIASPPRGTCGAPPCAAGSISLEPRDIRNFESRDIRSNGQRNFYQSPGTQ